MIPNELQAGLRAFFLNTARPDVSFANGLDPAYRGMSDGTYSDSNAVLAAVASKGAV